MFEKKSYFYSWKWVKLKDCSYTLILVKFNVTLLNVGCEFDVKRKEGAWEKEENLLINENSWKICHFVFELLMKEFVWRKIVKNRKYVKVNLWCF